MRVVGYALIMAIVGVLVIGAISALGDAAATPLAKIAEALPSAR